MVFASICEHLRAWEQCLSFLQARAVISFLMRAVSTLEVSKMASSETLRKFSASWNLSLLKRCLARSNLADAFQTGQKAQI